MEGHEKKGELRSDGRLAVDLVKPRARWVHRRVQKLTKTAPEYEKSQVTVDFTVPPDFAGSKVPISFLPKWPPLTEFDFKDEAGRPIPLLTGRQNQVVDRALLRELVGSVDPGLLDCAAVKDAIKGVTSRGPGDDGVALEILADHLTPFMPNDAAAELTLEMAAVMDGSSLLWVPIGDEQRGHRTVCSFNYTTKSDEALGWGRRALRSLGWYQAPEYVPLLHMGKAANFHLTVHAPSTMKVAELDPQYYEVTASPEDKPNAPLGFTSFTPPINDGSRDSIGQLYVSGTRPLVADVGVRLMISRGRVIGPAIAATTLIACLTTACAMAHKTLVEPDAVEATVTVLTVIPALISILLASQLRDAFVRRNALGIQLISMASGLVPLVMALTLIRCAFGEDDPVALGTAWNVSAGISWLLVLLLLVGQHREIKRCAQAALGAIRTPFRLFSSGRRKTD